MAINFTSMSQIERLNKLAEGGEAAIYDYDQYTVIKIFKKGVDLPKKEKKVKYFISIKDKLPKNVIGPQEIVTVAGRFVGYAMKKIVSSEDLHMLTKQKFLTAQGLSNRDVLQIITSVGLNLNKVHDLGGLVGDISDYNFQISGKKDYFIDVDSWGVKGKFDPDAYTELFTCPDSYKSNGGIVFSEDNEKYNFAILAFSVLTRIHPFGGTYLPDKKLSTLERMKRKISLIGKHKADIKVPKIIGNWKWMSPELEQDFIDIFENGKRLDITPNLQNLLKNMKRCDTHEIYYYSKFSECPLCNENAKVKAAPAVAVKVTQTAQGPQITIVFAGTDCAYILSSNHYLNKNNEVVHISSGRKFATNGGNRIDFSDDGKLVYVTSDDAIEIYNNSGNKTARIERMHKSRYFVKDRDLYYVDTGNSLIHLVVDEKGNMPTYVDKVYNPLFSASDDGKLFVASMYPKKAVVTTHDYTFEVEYSGRVNEYAIKYDKKTQNWLFVYQMSNGNYRTMVFAKNKVEYDDDVIMYNADTLSNIDFYNNTIYDPDDGKIIGTNIAKNTAKEFDCSVVDESSRLEFTGRGFKIYNKDKIYNYG